MNRHPVLACEGACDAYVKHDFVEERRKKNREGMQLGYEQIFACSQCKTQRRFGYTVQRTSVGN